MDSAATATGAGTETTAGVIMNFILVMVLYPDIQEKAHKLIKNVVGEKRLPTFQDRPSLPYIDAILRECLRWHPVFPLGAFVAQCKRNRPVIIYSNHARCRRKRRL